MTHHLTRRDLLRFSAIGLGSASLFAIAGCSTTGPATGGAGTPDVGGEATDFSFASWSLSEEAPKATVQAAIDAFAGDKGVSVETVTFPYNEYLNQLTLQVRGGQFAGAVQVDVAWLAALAALGKLADLGPLAEGRGYTDAALAAGRLDDVQYGLPWTIGAIGLIGNAELFDRAGASLEPASIEEFEEGLRALKGIGVTPYAAATAAAQLKDILMWMQTFGSPLVEGDSVEIGDEASVKAVEWYKKLFDEGLIAPDVDRFAARNLFAQEAAALYDDAPVGVSAVRSAATDPAIVDKMVPIARPVARTGDAPVATLWGHAVCVVSGDGEGTAAEFAQWLTSDDEQTAAYFEALSLPPATESGLQSEAVGADRFNSEFAERITATATKNPFWGYVNYAQMETAIAENVQAVLIGDASPADALAEAKSTIAGML
ncbi:sugar ABC transporter substrate-binding protein [Microbacterium sediminis]|uniref:sugar ABC transporter substrate-binding protein n=1 Tax=Microbacterium sediminis TaxID=904291 RepID=UPI001072308F|nr:extracellular solute-binding protein [Microbacterium sediminis]QBR75257.1 extracellular solute-binding protein [Microbacterium sediminis]